MASLKKDIEDILEAALGNHAINEKLDQILAEASLGNQKLDRILAGQQAINAAVLEILAYLGVESGGATPEQLEALGQRFKGLTDKIKSFDSQQT